MLGKWFPRMDVIADPPGLHAWSEENWLYIVIACFALVLAALVIFLIVKIRNRKK